MRCISNIRILSRLGTKTIPACLFVMVASMLLSLIFSACGTVVPAGKVVEGFFDAVHDADAERFKSLLDEETKAQFELSMDDVQVSDYLKEAEGALRDLYGINWRNRIRIASVEPVTLPVGTVGVEMKLWDVSVSIRDEKDVSQVIRVLEKGGKYFLDLSVMGDFNGTY